MTPLEAARQINSRDHDLVDTEAWVAFPQIVAALEALPYLAAEVERLRRRTHELQESKDQQVSALRKELKDVTRTRDTFAKMWFDRHPIIADHELTWRDLMALTPLRDKCAREMIAAHIALMAEEEANGGTQPVRDTRSGEAAARAGDG